VPIEELPRLAAQNGFATPAAFYRLVDDIARRRQYLDVESPDGNCVTGFDIDVGILS